MLSSFCYFVTNGGSLVLFLFLLSVLSTKFSNHSSSSPFWSANSQGKTLSSSASNVCFHVFFFLLPVCLTKDWESLKSFFMLVVFFFCFNGSNFGMQNLSLKWGCKKLIKLSVNVFPFQNSFSFRPLKQVSSLLSMWVCYT